MRINFEVIKEKCRSLPVLIALITGAVTFAAILIIVGVSKNASKDAGSDVSLEDTYLKDANSSYHNKTWGDVAGDADSASSQAASEVVTNSDSNTGSSDLTNSDSSSASSSGDTGNTANSGSSVGTGSSGSSSLGGSSSGGSGSSGSGSTGGSSAASSGSSGTSTTNYSDTGAATSNAVPSYNDGSSASIAGSSSAAGYAINAGFQQLYSNGSPVTNVYYYEENSVYCGQIVTYSNYTIIYLISRTSSFDASVKNVLSNLVGSYADTVWQKFITARVSQSFYIGEDNRLVRIVVPNVDGHYQIVIYN
ncbi:hypothetical protein [Lachnospira pectinoschiza]|uniref:Uncharacterized protein n=1 Tax=Lachnospira pectinoschiza TaxID=28052 RepID=A0A1G9TQK1_9FIRM|nr:hypothetical protein [Lachnospira pectinoschiza]SDM50037.1 hypothetical protein SAMN05216544_0452 [Lachnospira pectinoschiza]